MLLNLVVTSITSESGLVYNINIKVVRIAEKKTLFFFLGKSFKDMSILFLSLGGRHLLDNTFLSLKTSTVVAKTVLLFLLGRGRMQFSFCFYSYNNYLPIYIYALNSFAIVALV